MAVRLVYRVRTRPAKGAWLHNAGGMGRLQGRHLDGGEVDVRDFIQKNYTPYEGDESFLVGPDRAYRKLWGEVLDLLLKERERGGVLDMDTKTVTGIVSHPAGYIDTAHREKRDHRRPPDRQAAQARSARQRRYPHLSAGCSQHGYESTENVVERLHLRAQDPQRRRLRRLHPEMRACRSAHIITGLPDGYGRGRIIGDYRRVALYGVDYLIKDKEAQKASTPTVMTADNIRDREGCRSRSAPSASSR